MLNYYSFDYKTPDGETASGHCLAENQSGAEKLAIEFCKALKTTPANLREVCEATLTSLRNAMLWSLDSLTFAECMALLESTDASNKKMLKEVEKSVQCQQRILSNCLSIQDMLSSGQISDHIDDEDCVEIHPSSGRRAIVTNKRNDVLTAALSPLFNF